VSPDLARWTSIGRPIDPAWPTNRAIAVLSGLVVLGTAAIELLAGRGETGLGTSIVDGVLAGLAVFLAWALARELDPDRDHAAFAAALIALVLALWLGPPRFGPLVLLLLSLRIVNRTVGPPARPLDTLAILALAAWVAWSGGWIVVFATTLAFLLDATLRPAHRIHLAAAGAALALTGVAASRSGFPPAWSPATATSIVALVLLLPYLRVIQASSRLETRTDTGGLPLDSRRVRAAQALGLLVAVLAVSVEGAAGLAELSPLWSALAGCGLYLAAGRRPNSA